MEFPKTEFSGRFREDLVYLGVSLLIGIVFIAGHNYVTPNEPVRVGFTEVETRCAGIDMGFCLGVERQHHTTYNYDDYESIEQGTENFYRRVEAELMIQAYNICSKDVTGMEWTSEASYLDRTGDEWLQNQNVELLPCESTFYRNLTDS